MEIWYFELSKWPYKSSREGGSFCDTEAHSEIRYSSYLSLSPSIWNHLTVDFIGDSFISKLSNVKATWFKKNVCFWDRTVLL